MRKEKNTVTGASLLQGLKEAVDYTRGKIKLDSVEVDLPPIDAGAIRKKLNLTQEEFSEKYKLSLSTLRNWEQKRRVPQGPARILLLLIQARPEEIADLLKSD
jgi:putative transcriptional regulator